MGMGMNSVMPRAFAILRQHFRRKRYQQIQNLTGIESLPGFILDLGGGPASFLAAMFPKSRQVILVDVDHDKAQWAKRKRSEMSVLVADGTRLPLADDSVTVTVCNSVIEHVDDPDALAMEIRRVSQGYFLQTPHGGFPLETHSFLAIPFYNLIPWMWLRQSVCKVFGARFEYVNSVRYIPERELRLLFPEAVITYERVFGLIKSFYVYRPVPDALE
jgi:ubiquinone/menaquinone biosynthesis C-methylase UbiE